jgi:hypothetical protein
MMLHDKRERHVEVTLAHHPGSTDARPLLPVLLLVLFPLRRDRKWNTVLLREQELASVSILRVDVGALPILIPHPDTYIVSPIERHDV